MKFNKVVLLFLIFLSRSHFGCGQDTVLNQNQIKENIYIQSVDDSSFKASYRKDEDFNYTEKNKKTTKTKVKQKSHSSFWESFLNTIFQNSDVLVYLVVGLVIAFLLYFFKGFFHQLFQSFTIDTRDKNSTKKEVQTVLDLNLVQNNVNLKAKLNQFIAEKNYKEAFRYYFLCYLKNMQDQKIIQFIIDKTNEDYKKEIVNKDEKREFEKLSSIFEYFWYSETIIHEELFREYEKHFLNKLKI